MVFFSKVWNKPFDVETEHDLQDTDEKLTTEHSQPPVTKLELYSYLLYYSGDNGHTMYSYMPTLLQYMAYRGGFDPTSPTIRGCDLDNILNPCHVSLSSHNSIGGGIPVSSMVLYVQAFSFFIQFLLFTTFGALADFGRTNLYIVIAATILACTAQIIPITLINDDGSHWYIMALFMFLALVGYGATLVFYLAAYPRLSDNLPIVRSAFRNMHLSQDELYNVIEYWRKTLSVLLIAACFSGHFLISSILAGISFLPWSTGPFLTDGHTLGDTALYNYIGTVVCGVYWLLLSIPYFVTQPSGRRGPSFPNDACHLTFGWKAIILALKDVRRNRYLFTYLMAYFLFADALSTMDQLMAIIIGQITHFSTQQQTLMGLVFGASNLFGCAFFHFLSKYFGLSTKTILIINLGAVTLITVYGSIGIVSPTIGFKSREEIWVYCLSGCFAGGIMAYQTAMLAQLIPKSKENLFFGIFGIVSRASSWMGPVVIGAIAQRTGNLWTGWPVICGMYVVAIVIIISIDMDAAKADILLSENGNVDDNKES